MTLVSCLQRVQDRDGESNRPLGDVFEAAESAALALAARVCDRLGGWTGYSGKPGPVVMLKGLYEFRNMQLGYNLALTGNGNG